MYQERLYLFKSDSCAFKQYQFEEVHAKKSPYELQLILSGSSLECCIVWSFNCWVHLLICKCDFIYSLKCHMILQKGLHEYVWRLVGLVFYWYHANCFASQQDIQVWVTWYENANTMPPLFLSRDCINPKLMICSEMTSHGLSLMSSILGRDSHVIQFFPKVQIMKIWRYEDGEGKRQGRKDFHGRKGILVRFIKGRLSCVSWFP